MKKKENVLHSKKSEAASQAKSIRQERDMREMEIVLSIHDLHLDILASGSKDRVANTTKAVIRHSPNRIGSVTV